MCLFSLPSSESLPFLGFDMQFLLKLGCPPGCGPWGCCREERESFCPPVEAFQTLQKRLPQALS